MQTAPPPFLVKNKQKCRSLCSLEVDSFHSASPSSILDSGHDNAAPQEDRQPTMTYFPTLAETSTCYNPELHPEGKVLDGLESFKTGQQTKDRWTDRQTHTCLPPTLGPGKKGTA